MHLFALTKIEDCQLKESRYRREGREGLEKLHALMSVGVIAGYGKCKLNAASNSPDTVQDRNKQLLQISTSYHARRPFSKSLYSNLLH